jgi:hypothetical protein
VFGADSVGHLASTTSIAASGLRVPPAVVLHGHVPLAIAERLGSVELKATILRDPVARVVSAYEYVMGTSSHPLHSLVTAMPGGLHEFVTSPKTAYHASNMQTRLLGASAESVNDLVRARELGRSRDEAMAAFTSEDIGDCLTRAKSRVLACDMAVGVLEDIASFLERIAGVVGQSAPAVAPWLNTRPDSRRDAVSAEGQDARAAIHLANEADVELYRFVIGNRLNQTGV